MLEAQHCPKPELLSLYSIRRMSESIIRAVVTKINFTRQGPKGKRWQPSKEAVICNVHYLDYKGPSKANRQLIPVYFKRPGSRPTPPSTKQRRVQQPISQTGGQNTEELETSCTVELDINVSSSSFCAVSGSSVCDVPNSLACGVSGSSVCDVPSSLICSVSGSSVCDVPNSLACGVSGSSVCDVPSSLICSVSGSSVCDVPGSSVCDLPSEQTEELETSQTGELDTLQTGELDTLEAGELDTLQTGELDTSQTGELDTLQTGELDTLEAGELDTLQTGELDTSQTGELDTLQTGEQDPSQNEVNAITLISQNCRLVEENEILSAENIKLKQEIIHLKSTAQSLTVTLLNDFQLLMYTGICRKVFESLLVWLEPVTKPKKNDSHLLLPSQKFLMVLMRLRQNLCQNDLAFRFAVDQSTVSRTLRVWIPMLAMHLKPLIQWPKTNIGPTVPPYDILPNSVGIIDGTEIFIQRPSNLETQKSSYSDYKSHTTVKYLVAIDTFTGVFTFVSPGFSGNCSDRFTVQHSGLLDLLQPGQRILADKGYTARDLFAQKRCFLTIPSFLSDGRLSGQQAIQSRLIASVRIKVENAIKRLKDFKVFSDTLCNRTNKKQIDDMLIITCALCNLKPRLINN